MALAINDLRDQIDVTLLEDRKRRWMSDSQNSLREFYKTDVIPMSVSLSKTLKELQQELIEEVHEMLNIFESIEQKVEEKFPKEHILQTKIDRLLDVSLIREIQDCVLFSIAQQKNVLLENEIVKISNDSKDIQANLLKRIKILENDFKRSQAQTTRAQHQQEVNELVENINQKTYAYADVHSKNQDLLILIFELKEKIKIFEKGKNAKNVSKLEDNTDRSKPLTSHTTPKSEQKQKNNANSRNFNRVRMPKSKDTKSKNNALKNTNAKSSSAYVRKMSSSVRIDSNKHETNNSDECQSNANFRVKRAIFTSSVVAKSRNLRATSVVAKSRFSMAKTPTATNKVSTVSTLSPESTQSRTLSNYMKNKIATSRKWQKQFEYQHTAYVPKLDTRQKSKTAQSQSSETKSSTSVYITAHYPLIVDSGCSKNITGNLQLLRNFIEKFMGTVCFENDHFTAIIGYGDYVQGNLTICHVYYVEGLGHNLFSVG
ncbi:hypothetical protein Tco_0639274 [Tanacetum coccineum]